jgi:L-ascorbate metabolism protein UlaG (beta-lactamase superfamily)
MAGKASIKWLGHGTFIITSSQGKRVITDPWIRENPTCPDKLEDLPSIDLITVSHDHFDHAADVAEISQRFGAMVAAQPETAGRFKSDLGLAEDRVVNSGFGMNIGGSVTVQGITIVMTQAFHSSETGTASGYIIKLEDDTTFYHAGDTGIFSSMKVLGELYPLDVALLPIGGAFTMDPLQAAAALQLLAPKAVIPMHFKTFPFLAQGPDEFIESAKAKAPNVQIIVMSPGEEHDFSSLS